MRRRAAAADPAPVFRAGADVVSVEASVRRDRRPVIGLKAADFELLDNGVPQEITDVNYEKLPIDVTVLLDVSASVTGSALDELRRALEQLRTDLGARDRLRLLTFNMRVRRLRRFHRSGAGRRRGARVARRRRKQRHLRQPGRGAHARRCHAGRRQLIVLFSDGQDSSSIIDADTLLDVARRSTPTVAVVLASAVAPAAGISASHTSSRRPRRLATSRDQIASDTGGFVVAVAPGDNLTSTFRRVLEQFRTTYVLYFTPRGVERQGAHTLEVRVKRDKVEVRARRGYVWR